MSNTISILFALLCHPAITLAGHFGAHLDDAIIPSLVSGIGLVLLVQGGYYTTCRIWRMVRYKLIVRLRRQNR